MWCFQWASKVGANTLRNAERSYGVAEDLKGTKYNRETFSNHRPVDRGVPRLEDSGACMSLGTAPDPSPRKKGAQRGCGDSRYAPGRWPRWG